MGALTVVQRRSSNGSNGRQLDTLRSLGLRRIGHAVQVEDCPQARGMLHAVRHLVEVREGADPAKRETAAKHVAGGSVAAEEASK
jgi:large subunit ribosomal protein L30